MIFNTQVRRVDSATSGNILLVPLPKIDEMYAALHGARIFTTLDLRSGYYHINLDEESKAKTAFVTPFGKYEFKLCSIWFSTSTGIFPTINFNGFYKIAETL